jgi:hypothetical protein
MIRTLKLILADIDALTEDARRYEQLGRELAEKRCEIIGNLTDLGIKVTEARKMVARIEYEVTLPDGEAAIDDPEPADVPALIAEQHEERAAGGGAMGPEHRPTYEEQVLNQRAAGTDPDRPALLDRHKARA